MLISMTGFGRAECQEGDYTYQAEIRSVNNRFIEINTRLPKAYVDLEQPLKKLIKHIVPGALLTSPSPLETRTKDLVSGMLSQICLLLPNM